MTYWLKPLSLAGVIVGAILTGLGRLAAWWPALDIVNDGLPFLLAGTLLVFGLAALARDLRLIVTASLLVAINLLIAYSAMQSAASEAPPGSERALRIITFNVWRGNDRIDEVAKFLARANADAVVLQEVTQEDDNKLRETLRDIYPFAAGDFHLVILSKHPILEQGRLDRPGFPPWISLMLRWVRLDVNGTEVQLAGVHLARPFYPTLHEQDIETVIEFVQGRSGPLVIAGDFNMTPWTEKLNRLTNVTGLRRYNNLHFTWPLQFRGVPVLPFVATDNILASPDFTKIATHTGPRLGSDHRPVIADLALAAP
jgi:endonuclease/exonuclease/phosphatase (EEP) superfamily protein YafD